MTPENAEVEVYDVDDAPVPAEPDGAYLLMPGIYRYVVRAEGYVPAEGAFVVEAEPLFIPVALVEEAEADDALMDSMLDEIQSWQELQTRLDEAESGSIIQLSQHLTADVDSGDTALFIPADKTITLDLNGFTLDRGLDWPEPDGSAIIVDGTFTLEDSVGTGTITGGYADEKGGGVWVRGGRFTMNGGTIENNRSDVDGGGVYVGTGDLKTRIFFYMRGGAIRNNHAGNKGGGVADFFNLTMYGGEITGNEAAFGGGVYVAGALVMNAGSITGNRYEDVYNTNQMSLNGTPTIGLVMVAPGEQNKKEDFIALSSELQCETPIALKVDDELMQDNRLWLLTCPGTDLELNQRLLSYFEVSDAGDTEQSNVLSLDDEGFGLIYYSRQCYVRLRTGVGSDETISIPVGYGNLYTLPTECPFAVTPEHLTLIGWRMGYVREGGDSDRDLGESIMIQGDRIVTARWLMDWAGLKEMIGSAQDGDTITLPCDVLRGEGRGDWLEVPRGIALTLDLNGYTINGNNSDYSILEIPDGDLTLKDSYGTGRIIGSTREAIRISEGTFTMQGGELSGCGSGVYIGNDATFRLEGGSIINNNERGVVALGPVIMNGGRVARNRDGGFELHRSFEMNGGAISENTGKNGAGLMAIGATVSLNGGVISGNRGILGSSMSFGGGVWMSSGTLTIDGTAIEGNTTHTGAGVYVRESEFTLLSGSITGNAVYGSDPVFDNKGGGIYAENTPVNLLGGSVSGNSARFGGGLYLQGGRTTLNIADAGIVRGNTATQGGAGVALDGLTLELPMERRITGNTYNGKEANYWLLNGGRVHITRPLDADETLDVGASLGAEDAPAIITTDSGYCAIDNFTSALEGYGFAYDLQYNIVFGKEVPLVFDKGDAEAYGAMEDDTAIYGAEYTVPTASFIPPDERDFLGWRVKYDSDSKLYAVGNDVTIGASALDEQGRAVLVAEWGDGVKYVDQYGVVNTCGRYTYLKDVPDVEGVTLTTGWYVAQGEIFDHRVTIEGDVNLIITNAAADGSSAEPVTRMRGGIRLTPTNTLTIYGQAGWDGPGGGKLEAICEAGASNIDMAGIGGDTMTGAGSFTLCSGVVEAAGRANGAGIGGGYATSGGSVTIRNGKLIARGGAYAAGIGGGLRASQGKGGVSIFDGEVYAYGGDYAAGIGGGQHFNTEILGDDETGGNGGLVTIYGGRVVAQGGSYGAGIGGGQFGTGGVVTIYDGCEVTAIAGRVNSRYATAENQPQAIGRGYLKADFNEYAGSIVFSTECNVLAGNTAETATGYAGDAREAACRNTYAKVTGTYLGRGHMLIISDYDLRLGRVQLYKQGDEAKEITRASNGETVVVKVSLLSEEAEFGGLGLGYTYHGRTRAFQPQSQSGEGSVVTLTFLMPDGNVTITPQLGARTYPITFPAVPNGWLEAKVGGKVVTRASIFDDVHIVAHPDQDHWYFLDKLTVTDDVTGQSVKTIAGENENENIIETMPSHSVTVTASFLPGVQYINEAGKAEVRRHYEVIRSGSTKWSGGGAADGWYYVDQNTTINDRVEINCEAHLILGDGVTLTCKEGIRLPKNWSAKLIIYGQQGQTGELVADARGEDKKAGIGGNKGEQGGDVTVNGGKVTAYGGDSAAGIGGGQSGFGGNFTLNYGQVFTYGGDEDGAGLGGGEDRSIVGEIIINDGYLYAQGGGDGAGIGGGQGGDQGGHVIINGGLVSAHGGWDAAGIGGGDVDRGGGDGGKVTINGGVVYAYGGTNGAGIGGGNDGDGYDDFERDVVTINDGYVYACGGDDGAGIGGADDGKGGKVIINGGEVMAIGKLDAAGIGGGDDGDGGTLRVYGGNVTAEARGGGGAAIGGGSNESGGNVEILGGRVLAFGNESEHAIGAGNGKDKHGSLSIGDAMTVRTPITFGGRSPVKTSVREKMCHETADVEIIACTHPEHYVSGDVRPKDARVHQRRINCFFCNQSELWIEETHWYVTYGGTCASCGYDPWHALTVNQTGSGKVQVPPLMQAKSLETVRLRAFPDLGWAFGEVRVTGGDETIPVDHGTEDGITDFIFTMPDADVVCDVMFIMVPYAITPAFDRVQGRLTVTDAEGKTARTATMGETIHVTATAYKGFEVERIEVFSDETSVDIAEDGSFIMPPGNVTVRATFAQQGRATVYEVFAEYDEEWDEPFDPLPEQPLGSYTVPEGRYIEDGYRAAYYSMDGGETLIPIEEGETILIKQDCALIIYYKGAYTMRFDANGGTGEMKPIALPKISEFPLPDCDFIAPEGMAFIGWMVNGDYALWEEGEELDIDGDVTLTAEWDYTEPVFTTHSLLLSGDIGVNFFMALPELDEVDYEDSYMTFTVNGRTTEVPFDPDFRDVNEKGYYGFTAYVSSIQMAEKIHAVFHYGEDETVEQYYSVKDYILTFDALQSDFDETTVALVHALADYGHHIQPCLARANKWIIGVDYAEMDLYYNETPDQEAAARAVADYRNTSSGKTRDFERYTYTVNAQTRTELLLYITTRDGYSGEVKVAVDGKPVQAARLSDGRYRAFGGGVSAHQLDEAHTFTVTVDSGSVDVTFSPLAYVNGILRESSVEVNRVGVTAMYDYYRATENYRAAHNY